MNDISVIIKILESKWKIIKFTTNGGVKYLSETKEKCVNLSFGKKIKRVYTFNRKTRKTFRRN